ncbi:hypothetical protein OAG20_03275, partial [Verrucomicrobiales bacterium]|nr:hypothetical protein [Verrucomicrobiales bacterium]
MPDHAFATITYDTLEAVAGVREVRDDQRFKELFQTACPVDWRPAYERIIHRNDLHVDGYTEEEVKLRIIAPMLQIVNFPETGCEEWWERPLEASFGDRSIGGKVDFLLAEGSKASQVPYFF